MGKLDSSIHSIDIQGLTIQYSDIPPVLTDCNFQFSAGKTYLLTGTTASGKSTLLKFLNGIIPLFYPAKIYGILKINNKEVTLKEFISKRSEIGYLFQDPPLQVIGSTVERDIAFGLENLALPFEEIRRRIKEIAEILNISSLLPKTVTELSGGEIALVALASIMVLKPKILLLDEFTAFLDFEARKRVISAIKMIQDENRIIIIVSHHLNELLPIVDEVIVLDEGKIIVQAPQENFITKHYSQIKDRLRVPDIFPVGMELLKARNKSPRFETHKELSHLLWRESLD
jgi:energy-coupling factor transporter ATP-binding protein EcfA2